MLIDTFSTTSSRFSSSVAAATLAALFVAAALTSPVTAQVPPRGPDFDHNGHDDIAIGSPFEDWGSIADAGMVSVGYGSGSGFSVPGGFRGFLTQSNTSQESPEPADGFGTALAWGDFNGDCYDDLAVSAENEEVGGETLAGVVHVFYGSENGLSQHNPDFLHRDIAGVPEVVESGDRFGSRLAAFDFNGDGVDDLAVAADGADGGLGGVHIFQGVKDVGLFSFGSRYFNWENLGLQPAPHFGWSLAAGDFNCDGRDDLAIGSPFAESNGEIYSGEVVVLFGAGWMSAVGVIGR